MDLSALSRLLDSVAEESDAEYFDEYSVKAIDNEERADVRQRTKREKKDKADKTKLKVWCIELNVGEKFNVRLSSHDLRYKDGIYNIPAREAEYSIFPVFNNVSASYMAKNTGNSVEKAESGEERWLEVRNTGPAVPSGAECIAWARLYRVNGEVKNKVYYLNRAIDKLAIADTDLLKKKIKSEVNRYLQKCRYIQG